LGLTYIDTAEDYGMSEEVIGCAVRHHRADVILGTKFGPHRQNCRDIIAACEKSLRRLQTDYIDLYQMHWPNPTVPMNEVVNAFNKLLEAGKIKHVGFGNLSFEELKQINNSIKIDSLEMEYSLFDRYIERQILFFCKTNHIRLIAYSPIDRGRVCPNKGKGDLQKISMRYNKTIGQVALSWLTRDSVTAIPTCRRIEHVKENADADFDLNEVDIRIIDDIFKERILYIKPSQISVSLSGQDNRMVYRTLEEAKVNKMNLIPSPVALSLAIKEDIKPVRVVCDGDKYNLIEGRVRYWAWVLAYGDDPIPSYVRDNYGDKNG